MTGVDIGKYLDMELDKLTSYTCPSFLPEEKNYFLNKAYVSLIIKKFNGDTPNKLGFEANLRRIKELGNTMINLEFKTPLHIFGTSNTATLSTSIDTNRLVILPKAVTVKVDSKTVGTFNTEVISREFEYRVRAADNNRYVYLDRCPVVLLGSTARVYFDALLAYKYKDVMFTTLLNENNVITMNADAIRVAEKIDVKSNTDFDDMDNEFYYEVISTAATYMLENIESARTQTQPQLGAQLE